MSLSLCMAMYFLGIGFELTLRPNMDKGILMLLKSSLNITLVLHLLALLITNQATFAEDHLGHGKSDGERVLLTGTSF